MNWDIPLILPQFQNLIKIKYIVPTLMSKGCLQIINTYYLLIQNLGSYSIWQPKTKINTSDLSIIFIQIVSRDNDKYQNSRDKWLFSEIVNTKIKMKLGVFAQVNQK